MRRRPLHPSQVIGNPIVRAADGTVLPTPATGQAMLPGETLEQYQLRLKQSQGPAAGSNGLGTALGVAGGLGVAAQGLISAGQMPSGQGLDPVAAQKAELAKSKAQEQAVNNGVATAASSFGPVGALVGTAFKVGGGISSALHESNEDQFGLQKTDNGSIAKGTLAEIADPLTANIQAFKRFGDKDYSTREKILGALPMMGALFTQDGTNRKRARLTQAANNAQYTQGVTANQTANYMGLQYAAQGGTLRRRPLLVLAGGGKAPAPAQAAPAPAPRYTVKNPSPQAQQYYQQITPTAEGLIGAKHDEVYTDPGNGRQCTANSCLSFATTVLEKATGTQQPREKRNLYNPEFTRTAEQQGWVQIPLSMAQAGDRLQHWQSAAESGGDAADRVKDLGGRELIPGRYPAHMMVLGDKLEAYGDKGLSMAKVYQDGHQFANADKARVSDVSDREFVAYRYIGVNGQPTNDAQKAVAMNPAATATAPTAHRAQGGPVPLRRRPILRFKEGGKLPPSVIADGALHSQKNEFSKHLKKPVTGTGIPIIQLHESEAENGNQVAELEKDELTMSHELTEQVNQHVAAGNHEQLGKLVAEQLRTNTRPSQRYQRRLAGGGQVPHDATHGVGGSAADSAPDKSMAMLSPDGSLSVQMWLKGGERIFSRTHTKELVDASLIARGPVDHRRIGRRLAMMVREQDKRVAAES